MNSSPARRKYLDKVSQVVKKNRIFIYYTLKFIVVLAVFLAAAMVPCSPVCVPSPETPDREADLTLRAFRSTAGRRSRIGRVCRDQCRIA
jgi:hypothetical protein